MCSMNMPYMYFEIGSRTCVASTVASIGEGCGSTCARHQEEKTIAVEINPRILRFLAIQPSIEFILIAIKRSCAVHRHIWPVVVTADARAGHPHAARIATLHRRQARRRFAPVRFLLSAPKNELRFLSSTAT